MAQTLTDPGTSRLLAGDLRPEEAALDRIYATFARSDPFHPVTGFVDHVTMGAEALVALGLGDKAEAWASRWHARPYQPPKSGVAITTKWQEALGRKECHGDWIAFFDEALAKARYAEVLTTWVPRFAHDPGALLFHGVIRTGHATRALEHDDTPARRHELARGLALWAIGVRRSPPDMPVGHGSADAMLDYARRGVAAFLHTPSIVALHYVTGPMGYQLFSRHIDAGGHGIAAAGFGRTHANLRGKAETAQDDQELPHFEPAQVAALSGRGDVHAVKLTEAAFRGFEATEDARFLHAAAKML